jgi:hypothetical protein
VLHNVATYVEVETLTVGVTRLQTFAFHTVVFPAIVYVPSRVAIPRIYFTTQTEAAGQISSVALIGSVTGGAVLLAMMAGIIVFFVRQRAAALARGGSTDESTQPLAGTDVQMVPMQEPSTVEMDYVPEGDEDPPLSLLPPEDSDDITPGALWL